MSEAYVGVTVILRARTAKGVKLSPAADREHSAWIARSCIHGADDSAIDACALGDELSIRIFEWVARKDGLI